MRRVNVWAVLVAGIVFWGLGALWYGVLYGEKWMAALGKTKGQGGKMVLPMVIGFVLEVIE